MGDRHMFGCYVSKYGTGVLTGCICRDRLGKMARAATTGCVGTGGKRPVGFGWYYADATDSHRPDCCTSLDAVQAGVR